MGTGGSFAGIKRPGREAGHPPPSSLEVKNASSCRGIHLNPETTSPLAFSIPVLHWRETKWKCVLNDFAYFTGICIYILYIYIYC